MLRSLFIGLMACFLMNITTANSALPAQSFVKRSLQAATDGPVRRDNAFTLRHNFELHYLEGI